MSETYPPTTEASCEAHIFHRPTPLTNQRHTLIPQAWQRAWWPEWHSAEPVMLDTSDLRVGTLEGIRLSKAGLWAPGTVVLCPTGHINVHVLIARMMKALEAANSDEPEAAWEAIKQRGKVAKIAYQGLTGFHQAGGSLLRLAENGVYGGR